MKDKFEGGFRMKKLLGIVFGMVLLLGIMIAPSAQSEFITPYYVHVNDVVVSFTLNGNVASCYGHVEPAGSNGKAYITVKLQQKIGTKWTDFASWSGTASAFGKMAVAEGTKTLTQGYSYRVAAYGTIKDRSGNVLESVSEFSATRSY